MRIGEMDEDRVMIELKVNATTVNVDAHPAARLSDVLRNDLGLAGTKVGCNAGDCGACTVLIDGETACACLTGVGQVAGKHIATVEGLDADGTLTGLQQSFRRHGAAQCGICTPGMLVSAAWLLKVQAKPSRRQVEDALGGVLCRCTGYRKIVDAVVDAADAGANARTLESGGGVGAPIMHVDAAAKLNGTLQFGDDKDIKESLLVRVIRSPHHYAQFKIGDKAAFLNANDGIYAMLDATDIPGKNCHGVIPPFADQPVFAVDTVLHRGDPIAAIVGEPDAIRRFDENAFPVTWTPLQCVLKPAEALAPGAPQLHETRPGNRLVRGFVARGDVDIALETAAHRVRVRSSTPFIEHAYIEPEAGYAHLEAGRIVVHGCTQAPHMDREALADILDIDESQIRVIPTACGGGFGSKLDLSFQPYVALAAAKLKRPVAICYTRSESMQSTTKRHPSDLSVDVGCDGDGRLVGLDFEGTFNTGAYASWGPTVANRVPVHASGPYYIPHYRAISHAVHTNGTPAGAFRGFGVPQAAIPQERAFDLLADMAGIDRLEFRLRNALKNGAATVTGQVFDTGVGIGACLEALTVHWQTALTAARSFNTTANGRALRKGVGVASCWYGCGNTSLPNPSTIRIGITLEGRVCLHQGAVDIGQGANTVITQIAAEAIGIDVNVIERIGADTDLTPDAGKTSASRQTYVSGMAAKRAGEALRQKILRHANVGALARLTMKGGAIEIVDGQTSSLITLSGLDVDGHGYVFIAEESYDPPTSALDENGQGAPYAVYGYGAQMVELTVDTALGTVKLDKLTAAHDVGRAINPMLVEGQIEGGAAQGIGLALMEDYQPGKTENLHDYLIPTIGDMPEFNCIIVEVEDGEGPYGAKGLGEHVLIPTAPAIINAIRDATGANIEDLPATPDKVLAAIEAVRAGK